MRSNFFYFPLVFAFAVSSVFSQQKAVSQIPEVEPFKITRGTSFSASVPGSSGNTPIRSNRIHDSQITDDFADALELIRGNYVDGKKIDYNELTKSSLTAMLRSLDPHSNYFDSTEYEDLLTDQQSEYFGIGATIVNYQKNGEYDTFVTSTFPDSPAFRAGLAVRR